MSKYLTKPDTGVANATTANAAEVEEDDDWETEADYVNEVSEEQQRWGSKIIVPDRDTQNKPALHEFYQQVATDHDDAQKKEYEEKGKFSRGYGGEYGVEERAIEDAKKREEKEKEEESKSKE